MAEKLHKLAGILAKQSQRVENAATDILISRLLPWALGAQLDILGEWVGRSRTSLDDDVYRAAIQLQIYINNSSGNPEELTEIAKRITGATSVRYIEIGPAQYRLQVVGAAIPEGLLETIQALSPGGVRLLGIHTNWPLVPFRIGDRVGERLLKEA